MCRSSSRLRGSFRHCEEPLRRSNPGRLRGKILDCFAEPVIGPRFARTRWRAMRKCGDRVRPTLNNYTAPQN
ncbi:hypothetical protein FXB40_18375 [Bradyrhizobium rifense]|uniref:Uncharacterized protein n=1 Tax=Bradyrhizobium rifense TaxID=515499 RepID=A0A5D3KG84_9BRAD|nr:hypothetical protein FXB40_18375 [Bradyrhizobium rifense]